MNEIHQDNDAATLVANVNRLKYPPTIYSHGWIYGVWYCGTGFHAKNYYGSYPGTFVKRVSAMFCDAAMLHLCCGGCHIEGAVNLDLHATPQTDVVANAESLPFPESSFDVVLIDPPYSAEDASRYKVKRLLSAKRVLEECRRVLRSEGWILWLDEKYPSFKRGEIDIKGLIGIATGFNRRARFLSMFQVNKNSQRQQSMVLA